MDDPKLVSITTSDEKDKKYDALFRCKDCPCKASEKPNCGREEKTISFGAKGMSDYTKHKNATRKARYIKRHSGMGENWNKPDTAGALSRWILWNKPSFRDSVADYKRRFGL